MENKKVTYREFKSELKKTNEELIAYSSEVFMENRKCYAEIYEISLDNEPIELGVNWSAIGTVPALKAHMMAKVLEKAANLSGNFKFNGYTIVD